MPSKITKKIKKIDEKSNLAVSLFNIDGKTVEKLTLPKAIFGVKPNPKLVAQAVRVYRINSRQGTQSTKTRAEVAGSTRKIYKQKGTGRARHGDRKAPIFVGGGTSHGPHPRDFSAKLSQSMRRQALFSALSALHSSGKIRVISGLETIKGQTKEIVRFLTFLSLDPGPKIQRLLLVLPGTLPQIERAARNIEGVSLLSASNVNAYEVLRHDYLIFLKDSLAVLEKTFLPTQNLPLRVEKTPLSANLSSLPLKIAEKKPRKKTPAKTISLDQKIKTKPKKIAINL